MSNLVGEAIDTFVIVDRNHGEETIWGPFTFREAMVFSERLISDYMNDLDKPLTRDQEGGPDDPATWIDLEPLFTPIQ